MFKLGVSTPQRQLGKAPGKRRARPMVLPLLITFGLLYVAIDRWRAQEVNAELHQLCGKHVGSDSTDPSAASTTACSQPPLISSWALAEERARWHPPKYSTHTCISQKFYDNYHMATCKFDNMCINASTQQFEYYVDSHFSAVPDWAQGNPVAFDQNGSPHQDFPQTMVNPGHARIDDHVSWRPVMKRQPFPQAGPRVNWAPSDQALVHAFPPPLLWNFGHVMFDVMVPIFNMQHQFGLYDPAAQILIPFAVNGTDTELRHWLPKLINPSNPKKSVLRLTHDGEAAWVGEYAAKVLGGDGDGLVCFKTVLAGTGTLSRQQADVDSLPYRQAVIEHLGIREAPHSKPVITILNKKGRRMVENFAEIRDLIAARYPAAQVDKYDFAKRPNMTMRDQVQLMSDTSILLTPCGGLATVLTFMRPQTTAIVLNFWNTLINRSVQMEDNYYQHMEYLDFQYMPVTPQDYEGTTDRPECELVQGGQRLEDSHYSILGSLVHCNLRFQGQGLQRLMTYVDNAMQRWAARYGRYDVLPTAPDGDKAEGALRQVVERGSSHTGGSNIRSRSGRGAGS